MINILVDPYVFAYTGEMSAEGIEEYIETLTGFYGFLDIKPFRLVVSPYTPVILEETKSYPYWDVLDGIPIVQRRDLVAVVEGILKRASTTEMQTGCRFILLEGSGCSPNYHLAHRAPIFVEQYHQMVALSDLARHHGVDVTSPLLVTRGLSAADKEIRAWGSVADLESSAPLPYDLPHLYEIDLPNVCSVEDVIAAVDPVNLWLEGEFIQAVDFAVNQHPSAYFSWPQERYSWSMHPEFIDTATKHGFRHDAEKVRRLLRALAEVSIGENLRLSHALRTGKESTKPQRIRSADGSGAQRRDIDYEYHLHYWETPRGPEFASVGVHEDFSIPE